MRNIPPYVSNNEQERFYLDLLRMKNTATTNEMMVIKGRVKRGQ